MLKAIEDTSRCLVEGAGGSGRSRRLQARPCVAWVVERLVSLWC